MTWPEHVLRECFERLKNYYNQILSQPEPDVQEHKVQRVIVLSALAFGFESILAVAQEVNRGRVVQAAILCRPLYEAAAQVCWASNEPGGYKALEAASLEAEAYWLRSAIKVAPWQGTCEDYLQEIVAESTRLGCQKRVPGMQGILLRLCQHDGRVGEEACKMTKFHYSIYELFSLFQHGNIRMVGPAVSRDSVAQNAVTLCVFSTQLLVAAAAPITVSSFDEAQRLVACETDKTMDLMGKCGIEHFRCFSAQC
ncbi:MAG: hypothetical protein IMZ44_19840 [Planctomycetes bacterium]|nr:hypothetical protein [Planctomycetota bacterium]